MPPKKEIIAQNNNNPNVTNNNEVTTTAVTAPTVTITVTSTSNNTNSSATATVSQLAAAAAAAATNNVTISGGQAVYLHDVAAEQRTIAYQANAKLCRLVRKCPWMYDRNHHNYAKKHILDKSWTKIAKECNDSVASCKERWRNIRAAFARSINIYKTHSGPNRVKPYYLHKELTFLVKPMMEGRDRKDDYDDDTRPDMDAVKDDELEEEEEDDDMEQAEDEEEFQDETAEIKSAFEALNPAIRIHTEEYPKVLKAVHNNNQNAASSNNNNNLHEYEMNGLFEPQTEFTTNEAEAEFNFQEDAEQERKFPKRPLQIEADNFESKRLKLTNGSITSSEADVRFLEALLPDMALMNTRQKVIFKRKIYQTLEEVFENSSDFPNINTNDHHHINKSTVTSATTINSNNNNPSSSNNNMGNTSFNNPANATTITTSGGAQVRQTILTVNSSTARALINNIANLNESELQKVNGFLQNTLRNNTVSARLINGNPAPSGAAARLMHSTPKITITKVSCPPPAALRNLNAKPASPTPILNATNTTTSHSNNSIMAPNVHSTTSNINTNAPVTTAATTTTTNNNSNNSPWNQLMPITIKDEVEDVDVD
uniref:MADF domain-containing protein n=1 Tax=Glossina brevipalpis TaxID=37001 RepID=A0A1A9WE60_9MUSC